jgi:transposase
VLTVGIEPVVEVKKPCCPECGGELVCLGFVPASEPAIESKESNDTS